MKDASTPHTLFAPINDAFSSSSGDPCGNDPSRTVKYLISKTVSTSAYIGEVSKVATRVFGVPKVAIHTIHVSIETKG